MNIIQLVHDISSVNSGSSVFYRKISEYAPAFGHRCWSFDLSGRLVPPPGEPARPVFANPFSRFREKAFPRLPLSSPYFSALMNLIPLCPSGQIGRRFYFLIRRIEPAIRDIVRRLPDAVIHVSPNPFDAMIGLGFKIARSMELPLVVTPLIHPPFRPLLPGRKAMCPNCLRALKASSLAIALSDSEKRVLTGAGVPEGKVHVTQMGIDLLADSRDGRPAAPAGDDGCFRVCHIGMLSREKGAPDLIRALIPLWETGLGIKVDFIGPRKPGFDLFRLLLKRKHLRFCEFHGKVDDRLKWEILDRCDALVLPSIVDAFGIVFLEAWSLGKPVIGYRWGGVPGVIDHGVDGFLVNPRDIRDLTLRIDQLRADPGLRKRMGEAGKAKALLSGWSGIAGNIFRAIASAV